MKRTARITSTVDAPAVVAAALRPDNTDQMTTELDGNTVVTTIERETTGGLRSTLDDYVRSLIVAGEIIDAANRHTTTPNSTNT
ncbi:MAG: KEOPS complex subunit Pcc1 [Halodesulfurarchaeum sp.]